LVKYFVGELFTKMIVFNLAVFLLTAVKKYFFLTAFGLSLLVMAF